MADIYANMGKNLIGTKTFDNLMEAFAGSVRRRVPGAQQVHLLCFQG